MNLTLLRVGHYDLVVDREYPGAAWLQTTDGFRFAIDTVTLAALLAALDQDQKEQSRMKIGTHR